MIISSKQAVLIMYPVFGLQSGQSDLKSSLQGPGLICFALSPCQWGWYFLHTSSCLCLIVLLSPLTAKVAVTKAVKRAEDNSNFATTVILRNFAVCISGSRFSITSYICIYTHTHTLTHLHTHTHTPTPPTPPTHTHKPTNNKCLKRLD